MKKLSLLWTIALLSAAIGWPGRTRALVNPNFTVVDLKAASTDVWVLEVSSPKDNKLSARVVKVLAGKPLKGDKAPTLTLDFTKSDLSKKDIAAPFGDAASAVGVMFVRKERNEFDEEVASLQIGTTWMGLIRTDDNAWDIVKDPDDLETTWAGSAEQLVRAVKYVVSEATANFPVECGLEWGDSRQLATLKGTARGMLHTDDGIIVLSDGGDRVIRPAERGGVPTDVTDKLKLTSQSRKLAAGDLNGDGRVDLVSWNGKRLRLVLRVEDGTFAAPADGPAVTDCHSLISLGGAVLVAHGRGLSLAKLDGGKLTMRRVPGDPAAEALGAGGAATVADFNDDGRPDALQVFEKGLLFYPGQAGSQTFAKPKPVRIDLLKEPADLTCGDFDQDGRLDALVVGKGGATMLSLGKTWRTVMYQTGELAAAFMPGRTQASATSACTTDLRGDGRQTVAIFSAEAAPGLFYARGFGCFAIAIGLTRAEEETKGFSALSRGQQAALAVDLNGDRAPDLLGVDHDGKLWAAFTKPHRQRRFTLTVSAPPPAGPMTVRLSDTRRVLGVHVLQPGRSTLLPLPRAGRVTLTWKTPDGGELSRNFVVARPTDAGQLTPARKGTGPK